MNTIKQPRSIAELKALCEDMGLTLVRESYAEVILVTFQQELDKSWVKKTIFHSYLAEITMRYFYLRKFSLVADQKVHYTESANFKYFKRYFRRMYNNYDLILFGYSICNPSDDFSPEYGLRIAVERLLASKTKQTHANFIAILKTMLDRPISYLGISIL